MSKSILSICIPTKNRAMYLKETLCSIVSQQPFVDGKVEVVISDNVSSDSTKIVVKEFIEKYKNIKYFKNEEDVEGINFSYALARGTGLYRKLANDTVRYLPGSLEDMVNVVENNQDKHPVIGWKTYSFRGSEYKEVYDWEDFFLTPSYWLTWISAHGAWEEECDGIVEDCVRSRDKLVERIKRKDINDMVARAFPMEFSAVRSDVFWQMRFIAKQFNKKKHAIFVPTDSKWLGMEPSKRYHKGMLKWCFYDYYLDIIREFVNDGKISNECMEELERDIGYSFFIGFMLDIELKKGNIMFDTEDTLIQDILNAYKEKTYYKSFVYYYQSRRKQEKDKLTKC